jgi:hypothetical protein
METTFDMIEVGAEFHSAGRTVTEADIVNFAGVTGDFNPLHMDEQWVRANTDFPTRIAHGLLVHSIGEGCAARRSTAGRYSPFSRPAEDAAARSARRPYPAELQGDVEKADLEGPVARRRRTRSHHHQPARRDRAGGYNKYMIGGR